MFEPEESNYLVLARYKTNALAELEADVCNKARLSLDDPEKLLNMLADALTANET